MPADFRDVDPAELRVPTSRPYGADPAKLQRQIAQFGKAAIGMPPPWSLRVPMAFWSSIMD
jgi:hypothetical protein